MAARNTASRARKSKVEVQEEFEKIKGKYSVNPCVIPAIRKRESIKINWIPANRSQG